MAAQNDARPTLVVGLGASAGGLEALDGFLSNLPEDTGLAFVVVTHQHPTHTSLMPELLQKQTVMPVVPVSGDIRVEPNHVYVATPGADLVMEDGTLHRVEPRGARSLPIDTFFRSLALDCKHRAVGVVLSGTGTDGTLGIKEIKGASGMVMVQSETSAAYPGMPASAIATKLVDFVRPVQELPEHLLTYAKGPFVARPRESGDGDPDTGTWLPQIFVALRERTGHDFSGYKPSTIGRRIERRMNVHHIEDPERYVPFLQSHLGEVDLLFKELLIGVTSFFRDAEAWARLQELLMAYFASDADADADTETVFRAWVPGCSTGEEAYSLAIVLRECMEASKLHRPVQIFATDIDAEAIDVARSGVYPDGVAADVSKPRLSRFFTYDDGYYRVHKELREMVVFAPQNLLVDPPFTKLHLLSCRNLLIYFGSQLQQRVLPLFHYSLAPKGILFLGTSESLGSAQGIFEPLDKKWKIFRRRDADVRAHLTGFASAGAIGVDHRTLRARDAAMVPQKVLLRELVPPTVVVRERGDIVFVHGSTGQFLEPAPGAPAQANVFNMARRGLQIDLAAAMREAGHEPGTTTRRQVRVKSNGDVLRVQLEVRRLTHADAYRGLYLISFTEVEKLVEAGPATAESGAQEGTREADLEHELQHARENHQTTIEELETTNEELKSTNEELQSTNEELQSANEELETSKEEMQSLNEELQTVNAELQDKIDELSHTNDDMRNLLDGTDIATIFLSDELEIKRFTQQAKRVINLLPSDIGRPIGDLVAKLRYDRLAEDASTVKETLVPKELEVQGPAGTWYLMRILPYRTTENVIEGLVITFADVTRIKRLEDNAEHLRSVLERSPTSVFCQGEDMRYRWAYGLVFGHPAAEVVGKMDADLLDVEDTETLASMKRKVLRTQVPAQVQLVVSVAGQPTRFDLYVQATESAAGLELRGVLTELGDSP